MFKRRTTHRMSNERFESWFTEFCRPYTQERFIHSYKALENSYSELVIRYLLTTSQRHRVQRFLNQLPKMNRKRFNNLRRELRRDTSILHRYSAKDFTARQQLIVRYYLYKELLGIYLSNIGSN